MLLRCLIIDQLLVRFLVQLLACSFFSLHLLFSTSLFFYFSLFLGTDFQLAWTSQPHFSHQLSIFRPTSLLLVNISACLCIYVFPSHYLFPRSSLFPLQTSSSSSTRTDNPPTGHQSKIIISAFYFHVLTSSFRRLPSSKFDTLSWACPSSSCPLRRSLFPLMCQTNWHSLPLHFKIKTVRAILRIDGSTAPYVTWMRWRCGRSQRLPFVGRTVAISSARKHVNRSFRFICRDATKALWLVIVP